MSTYKEEAVDAVLREFGITDALAHKVIEIAEPFIRNEVEDRLAKESADRRSLAAAWKRTGDIEMAVLYERAANAIESASRAVLVGPRGGMEERSN